MDRSREDRCPQPKQAHRNARSLRVVSLRGVGAGDVKALQGREELRLRIGDYRLFFVCTEPDTIEIRRVRHRSEAYR